LSGESEKFALAVRMKDLALVVWVTHLHWWYAWKICIGGVDERSALVVRMKDLQWLCG
jgi:hypothetical protein